MSETEYATKDGARWLTLTAPDGLIPPPTIQLHQPEVGAVWFYYAEVYGITRPAPAGAAATDERGGQ